MLCQHVKVDKHLKDELFFFMLKHYKTLQIIDCMIAYVQFEPIFGAPDSNHGNKECKNGETREEELVHINSNAYS